MQKYARRRTTPCRCVEIAPPPPPGQPPAPCIERLLWLQAWVLHEVAITNGCIGHIAVGGGKTIPDLLAPLAFRNCQLALLLVPASLLDQMETQYKLIAEHFFVPGVVIHLPGRRTWSRSPEQMPDGRMTPVMHVISYNKLSDTDNSNWLEQLRPDVIIADECFPGHTKVLTDEGWLRIDDVVDNQRATYALSFDKASGLEVWKPITRRLKREGNKQLVRVEHEFGNVICTEDHKIWTVNRGYVQAAALEPTDTLRMCVVRPCLQTKAVDKEVLLQEMRFRGTGAEGKRGSCTQARRQQSGRDTNLQMVSGAISSRGIHHDGALQREVLEAAHTAQAETMPDMRERVHSVKGRNKALQPQVLRQIPHQEAAQESKGRLQNHFELSELREGVQNETKRQKHVKMLLSALWSEPGAAWQKAPPHGFAPEDFTFRVQQKRRDSTCFTGKTERPNVSVTRGEWSTDEAAITSVHCIRSRRSGDGVRDSHETGCGEVSESAALLQGGPRDPGNETSDRDRWEESQQQEVEVSRSSQDRDLKSSRVVGVSRIESRCVGENSRSGHTDPIYDLTVKDTHCYFADGVLVSNCDALSDRTSARTLRLMRYFQQFGDQTRFAGWTGSLTDSRLSEFAHLSALTLRERSPLPLDKNVVDEWGGAIDAQASRPAGALKCFLEPHEDDDQIRQAFSRRMAETSGFILIQGTQKVITPSGIEVSLDIREKQAPPLPPIVQTALDMVRASIRPDTLGGAEDDEVLVEEIERIRCAREVATGCYYRHHFPRGEPKPLRQEWYAARKLWRHEQRAKILRGEPFLDSAKLTENAARRAWGELPIELDMNGRPKYPDWQAEHWPRWAAVKDLVEPKQLAVRLHPFLIEDAAQWAFENIGIIWIQMREFGAWLSEFSGLPVFGEGSGKEIIKESGNRSIIASINSHGRGRDRLQFAFHKQLFANVPASSRRWQQALGRIHRRGQRADEVSTEIYLHTDEVRRSLEQALKRSEYVQDTMREGQKLLHGWHGTLEFDED